MKKKKYNKKLNKIKPTNFHNVPKLIVDFKKLVFELMFVHIRGFVLGNFQKNF